MKVRITHNETNPTNGKSKETRTRDYTIGSYDTRKNETIVKILPEGKFLRRSDQNYFFAEWSSQKHAEETIRCHLENTTTKDSDALQLLEDWEGTSKMIENRYTGSGGGGTVFPDRKPSLIYHASCDTDWDLDSFKYAPDGQPVLWPLPEKKLPEKSIQMHIWMEEESPSSGEHDGVIKVKENKASCKGR